MATALSAVLLDEVKYMPITHEIALARLATGAKDIPDVQFYCIFV